MQVRALVNRNGSHVSEPASAPPRWSEDQVRKLIETEDFRYQKIDLPYGLSTKGHDRSATARQIFPQDLTGKTVLDLGCSFGFFCFEAVKRGASRVVGFDVDPESI